jgi:hypothetical protein
MVYDASMPRKVHFRLDAMLAPHDAERAPKARKRKKASER